MKADAQDNGKVAKPASALLMFLKLLASPVEGWKRLRRSKMKAEQFAAGCMYPVLGLMALSQLTDVIFGDTSLTEAVINAVVLYVAMMVTAYLLPMIGMICVKGDDKQKFQEEFARKYSMVIVSSLALFVAIYTLVYPLRTILVFLPIYTPYLISRGTKYLRLSANRDKFITCLMSVVAFGLPALIYYIFTVMLQY